MLRLVFVSFTGRNLQYESTAAEDNLKLALMMLARTLAPSSESLQPDRFSSDTVWLARKPSTRPYSTIAL